MSVKLLPLLGILPFTVAAFANQTAEAEEGDAVVLRCLLDRQDDLSASTVEWSKDGRGNIVHLYAGGGDRVGDQKDEFRDRTVLFREGLDRGNVTLRLSPVRLSDAGTYRCYVRRPDAFCYTVLRVVKRSEGNDSSTPPPPLETDGPDGGNRSFTCLSVVYTGFAIFCVALGGLTVMVLGTIWIYKKIQERRRRAAEATTADAQMGNLGGGGRDGGERPSRAAGDAQQQAQ